MKGQLTVGTLVAFLGYIGGLFGPVQGLSGVYKTLRTASVSIRQVFSILDAQDSLGPCTSSRGRPSCWWAQAARGRPP
jgi:ATP-binding cassette subfamily B protein